MRNVLFVAPFAFDTTLRFVEAAAVHPDSRLILLSQDPLEKFPQSIRRRLAGHWQVSDCLHPGKLVEAVESVTLRFGRPHCLLGTLEHLQVQLGQVRDHLGIPGMGAEAADNFRDKARMKTVMRAAGLPCARHRLLGTEKDAWEFIEEVGYPIVVKPPAGAGAKATYSINNEAALRDLLAQSPPHPKRPMMAEEFIRGTEHSFDGISLGGKLVWHSLTHYLPSALDAVRNPWIQWCVLLPREIDDPEFDDIRKTAAQTLDALGMETGVSHMEWFRRGDGSIAISEVGARPGGAQISKLISYAHDLHFYRAWAEVMIDGTFTPPERRYATGAAFLRGQGQGRIRNIHGLEQAQRDIGPLVVESHLPRPGQFPSTSYEGDGFVILRHPKTEVVKDALHRLISVVRVELG